MNDWSRFGHSASGEGRGVVVTYRRVKQTSALKGHDAPAGPRHAPPARPSL